MKCSPKLDKDTKEYTCYSDKELTKLKHLWNSRHDDDLITSTNSKEIHDKLANRLIRSCDTESCWLKKLMKVEDSNQFEYLKSFAPRSPAEWKLNPNEWLSSTDINSVMKQYEKTYECFKFMFSGF